MNKRTILIILLLSVCAVLPGGCKSMPDDVDDISIAAHSPPPDPGYIEGLPHDEYFDMFLDELFEEWITEDTLTMQFFLADPEAMGIARPAPAYGEVMTPQLLSKARAETTYISRTLSSIDYNLLNEDQKVIYEIIERTVEISRILEEDEDYIYYMGYIRPVTGIQIQLPILLAEFRFDTADDIELYLELLEDTERYFDDIIAFERERAARGYFLSDANIDTVISQIEAFTANKEDNLLITVINDKIGAIDTLGAQQRDDYKQRNRELVTENVLKAYGSLLDALKSLKGTGANSGGIATLPDGEKYAYATYRLSAGTDRSVAEIEKMIGGKREVTLARVRELLLSDDDLMRRYSSEQAGQIPYGTPGEYIGILQDAVSNDYPPIGDIGYDILQVHESLQEHISPAFYLAPAIDRFNQNVIYINPAAAQGDNLALFTVLAHEGYPGHLYETVYFRQQNKHPIRVALSNTGYTEGWATYAEYMGYRYAGLDITEAELMHEVNLYFLMLFAHIDIGVNLLGWGIGEIEKLLSGDLGISDAETVESYYNWVTGTPLNISMYAQGYLEIMMLREETQKAWGDEYSLYDFHSFILGFGPAPFDIIRSRIAG